MLRKIRHRLSLHQSIGLNKSEAALLADVLEQQQEAAGRIGELTDWLRTSVQAGVPANLTMEDARAALLAIDSAGSTRPPVIRDDQQLQESTTMARRSSSSDLP